MAAFQEGPIRNVNSILYPVPLGMALLMLAWAGCSNNPTTPTGTATETSTPTVTSTSTPSPTPPLTATSTATFSPTHTPTLTFTQTPTDSPTPLGSPTPTDSPTVTPTCFMGSAPTISGDFNNSGYAVLLFPFQAPSTGNIYKMTGEILSTVGSPFYQYGVYADDGSGNPTNLLGSTSIITPPGGAFDFQTQTFGSPIPITAGNTYWLAFLGNVALYDDYLSTAGQNKQINVAGGPTPMPSSPAPASITGLATGQPVFYLYASTCP